MLEPQWGFPKARMLRGMCLPKVPGASLELGIRKPPGPRLGAQAPPAPQSPLPPLRPPCMNNLFAVGVADMTDDANRSERTFSSSSR